MTGIQFFEGDVLAKTKYYKMGPLVTGLLITLEISIYSIFFAIIIGVFTGLARISKKPVPQETGSFLYRDNQRHSSACSDIYILFLHRDSV